jgi:transposase
MEVHCSCGSRNWGVFPPAVAAPVQYGSRLLALSSLLNTDFRIPFAKISTLFGDLFGYAVNEATICSANASLFKQLEPVETSIRNALEASPLLHVDETGLRVKGKLHWLHVVCSQTLTYWLN